MLDTKQLKNIKEYKLDSDSLKDKDKFNVTLELMYITQTQFVFNVDDCQDVPYEQIKATFGAMFLRYGRDLEKLVLFKSQHMQLLHKFNSVR